MANAYVEMDAKKYVKFMKEQMAAKARAQNFKKARVRLTEELTLADWYNFTGSLMEKLGKIIGVEGASSATTLEQVGSQISTNIGNNFQALRNFAGNVGEGVGGFFKGLGGRVTEWLGKLGSAVGQAASWMGENSSLTLGGTPLTKGTLVALAVLSAVILIGGYKYFKGLATKSDQNNNNNQNQNTQQNQNVQTNNMQTNNTQPTEGALYDSELKSYLDEGTKYTNELMDALIEQTELSEGIFDMFSWLGKMTRKAAGMVKEMFGYAGRFAKKHPIIAALVLVCIFFILFCTPGLQTILGEMGKAASNA